MNSIVSFAFSVQSLKCHVNEKGADPEQVTCKYPNNKFCNYIIDEFGDETRNCSSGEGLWPKVGCTKTSKFTSCLCETDNCNYRCNAEDCKRMQISWREGPNADVAIYDCKATCEAEGKIATLLYIAAVHISQNSSIWLWKKKIWWILFFRRKNDR